MKLVFQWYAIIDGRELYTLLSQYGANYIRSRFYRTDVNTERKYILLDENKMTFKRLTKYGLELKKL